jgi:hypothetical protein
MVSFNYDEKFMDVVTFYFQTDLLLLCTGKWHSPVQLGEIHQHGKARQSS